jgi:hypothetical protein
LHSLVPGWCIQAVGFRGATETGSETISHLSGRDERLVNAAPLLHITYDWESFLSDSPFRVHHAQLAASSRNGLQVLSWLNCP